MELCFHFHSTANKLNAKFLPDTTANPGISYYGSEQKTWFQTKLPLKGLYPLVFRRLLEHKSTLLICNLIIILANKRVIKNRSQG